MGVAMLHAHALALFSLLRGSAASFDESRLAPSLRETPFASELLAQHRGRPDDGAGSEAPAAGAQCILIPHTDLMGNDLLSSNTSKPLPQPCDSPAACCDMCTNKRETTEPKGTCHAWSFNHGSKTCWMKSKTSANPRNCSDTSGVLRPQPLPTQYLEVPLDHSDPTNPKRHRIRYWVANASWNGDKGAPLVLDMPGEGGTGPSLNVVGNLTATLGALEVRTEHRFFGQSVPSNDSTTDNLKYLSVEQNLADLVSLVKHVKVQLGLSGPVVASGGSYSGASTCWLRTKYPDVISAGVAESASIHAIVDFYAYDQHLAKALAESSASCEERMAATVDAIDAEWENGRSARSALKVLFGQNTSVGTPMGDADFLYMLGDSVASQVQYGNKDRICSALAQLPEDADGPTRVQHWANFTLATYGKEWVTGMWYNSETMRITSPGSDSRAWYWLKCSELAYLQTAPRNHSSGNVDQPVHRMRSRHLTAELLLAQCKYIYGDGLPDTSQAVNAFNARFGGSAPQNMNASKVLFLRYSDDPWQPAQPVTSLSPELPLILTQSAQGGRNGSCAHCGAGCTPEDIARLNVAQAKQVRAWLKP